MKVLVVFTLIFLFSAAGPVMATSIGPDLDGKDFCFTAEIPFSPPGPPNMEEWFLWGMKGCKAQPLCSFSPSGEVAMMEPNEPIPEPSSLLLLGAGVIGSGGYLRWLRKRRR